MRTMLVMGVMMVSVGLGGTSALAGKRTLVVGAGDALRGLERASPEVGPWPSNARALMLSSQINKALDRAKDSNEAMRRIVRVDPHFKADPNAWPPSTMQALELVRKEVQRSKKGLLKVNLLAGAESSVFVDGREVGKTPLRLELPQGTYRLSLLSQDAVSFPRVVNLGREETVQIYMAFEGSILLLAALSRWMVRYGTLRSASRPTRSMQSGARHQLMYGRLGWAERC